MFKASSYQSAIFSFVLEGTGNCIINAVAGSGKTTTLVEASRLMSGKVIAVMFNKKIQLELDSRFRSEGINATASTVHSLCFSAYRKKFGYVTLDANKVRNIVRSMFPEPDVMMYGSFVDRLIRLSKDSGFGLGGDFPSIYNTEAWEKLVTHHDLEIDDDRADVNKAIDMAKAVLVSSNTDLKTIDFSDQIYLTLLRNAPLPKFDWVLVDECQDLSPLRQAVARAILPISGRAIFVGDKNQAIYGFSGADSKAMENLKTDFRCEELPLSISYRCSKAVINFVQPWNSVIQSHENAVEGSVTNVDYKNIIDNPKAFNFTGEDAIICRNNSPLVQTAFSLLAKGVGCRIEGKDIGTNLINLANKWKVKSLNSLVDRLNAHLDRETQKARSKGNDSAAGNLEDKVECLKVLIGKCQSDGKHSMQDLKDLITALFTDSDGKPSKVVTLCSAHKSKGLEWTRVFLLDRPSYMPSKWATKDWMLEQERNLIYVAITRAKRDLIEVTNVKDFLTGKRN